MIRGRSRNRCKVGWAEEAMVTLFLLGGLFALIAWIGTL